MHQVRARPKQDQNQFRDDRRGEDTTFCFSRRFFFDEMMAGFCSTESSFYYGAIFASLLFSCGLYCYAGSQHYFEHDLPRGQKVCMCCGAVKIAIGILLWTVLYPGKCVGLAFIYPIVAITTGVYLMLMGLQFRRKAASPAVAPVQGGDRTERTVMESTITGEAKGDDIETGA